MSAADEPAACYPSRPTRLCEHCARHHADGHLREPRDRFGVVIDASVTVKRTGGCCLLWEPPPAFAWPELRRRA